MGAIIVNKEIYPPLDIDIEEYQNENNNESPIKTTNFLLNKYPKRWKDKHSARASIVRVLIKRGLIKNKKNKKDNLILIYPLFLIHQKCGKKRKVNVKFIKDNSLLGISVVSLLNKDGKQIPSQLSKCFYCEKNKKFDRFFITKRRIEQSGYKFSEIIDNIKKKDKNKLRVQND